MKVIAAYMLATLGGNTNPSVDDLKKIFGSVGAEVDEHKIESFLSQVSGKNITELIASGKERLASVPSGDVAADVAADAAAPPVVVEETKVESEEKVEEEEEDDEPLFPLFDSDSD